jgi:hypothetical protein
MIATLAQTRTMAPGPIDGIALRRATLADATTIVKHRRLMFRDMGYHEKIHWSNMDLSVEERKNTPDAAVKRHYSLSIAIVPRITTSCGTSHRAVTLK